MKNKYIPYQQSLELKELGFDEPCMYAWCVTVKHRVEYDGEISLRTDGNPFGVYYKGKNFNEKYDSNKNKIQCSAPLYQQVFRWFREKYNLRGFIGFRPNIKQFDYHIYDMSLSGKEYVKQRTYEEFQKDPKFGTYEEAELECTKELISIVKNKYK